MNYRNNANRSESVKRRQNNRRPVHALTPESLESRLPLDASGFVGNACAPNLDLSAVALQTARVNEELVLDLTSAGATATDLDASGNPTGDMIRFQLDPDDGPANATLTEDGVFRWTPDGDQVGTFEFVVIAIDEGDPPLADAEVFFVQVTDVVQANEAPDLADIADTSVAVNEELTINLSASDPDGDNLTFLLDPDLTINGMTIEQTDNNNAVLRWTPAAADSGQSFDVSVLVVDDGFPPKSDNERFVVGVMSVNAEDETYSTPTGQPLTIDAANGVLANDIDSDGDVLTATLMADATNGDVVLSQDGAFTYTPDDGFQGTDTFTYQAQDGGGDTSTATVTINVDAGNSTPLAADDAFSVDEDVTLTVNVADGVLANDNDADGEMLTATIVQDAQSGQLTFSTDGSFEYTPEANFSGMDTFTYVASDGAANSSEATITITVNAVNDTPLAVSDAFEATEDIPLVVAGDSGLLANDSDEEGVTLTISVVEDPANGNLNWSEDGSFTYTPNNNYNGIDTFTYTVSDGDLSSDAVVASITVGAVNDAPVANPDTYAASEGEELSVISSEGVLANDVDVDGDAVTVELVSDAANGSLELNPDGSFTYTSNAGFSGPDTFTYSITDGDLDSSVVTVAILVTESNQAPVGVMDTYQVTEDEVFVIDAIGGVLANDSDSDGDSLSAVLKSQPTQGLLTFNDDGSFEYTANQNSTGLDGFAYQVSDGMLNSAEVLVVFMVTTSNDAPIAQDDSYEVSEDEVLNVPVTSGVLTNDMDIEDDSLEASLVSQAGNGTVDLQSDGSFSYTPNDGFTGIDTFTYEARDGTDPSGPATVSIDVTPHNVFAISSGAAVDSVVGTVIPEGEFDAPVIYQFANDSVNAELLLNADDHISGDPTAAVVLIEYLDFQCPVCASFHPIVSQLEESFTGELLVVRRHFPLESIHPNARAAARAAEAAGRQGRFEEMGDLLFENQADWAPTSDPTSFFETYATDLELDLDQFRADAAGAEVDARILRDANAAVDLGGTGTPTFFVNNTQITNPSTSGEFESIIQGALDAVDDAFAINRKTGEIVVADNSNLESQTLVVLVTDVENNTETIDAGINVSDTTGGGVMAFAFAVDDAVSEEDDWLSA